MSTPDTLLITQGDPAGVGPEVIVRALSEIHLADDQRIIVSGHPQHFRRLMPDAVQHFVPWESAIADGSAGSVTWAHAGGEEACNQEVEPGQESECGSRSAIQALERAAAVAVESSETTGLCTGPIHKANLARAGYTYPGHTEFLADRSGTNDFAMMLAIPGLRVVPATIHTALRNVPDLLDRETLLRLFRLVCRAMIEFDILHPRVAVAGLNPHAGEEGRFGTEEEEIIAPAVQAARRENLNVQGPYPGDTLFHRAHSGEFDVVVAMYHDQALIPIKTLNFHGGVNVTLGLPFVRTSPDHGTAYGIAGQGRANHESMVAAIRMGFELIQRRRMASSRTANP